MISRINKNELQESTMTYLVSGISVALIDGELFIWHGYKEPLLLESNGEMYFNTKALKTYKVIEIMSVLEDVKILIVMPDYKYITPREFEHISFGIR